MSFGLRLLKLSAKIALDRLIGSTRVDEAATLLQDWWASGNEASRDQDIADAREAASDSRQLDKVIAEVVAAKGGAGPVAQVETLALSLSSAFKEMPAHLGNNASSVAAIEGHLLPGRRKTFVVWLNHPAFSGPLPGS
jgi:hypothetical protein